MPAVLICADTIRSPEMRHEVPAEIMDPFLYAEVAGRRYAVVSQLEVQAVNEKAPDIEVILPEQLGWDELVERHPDWEEASQELVVRACRRMGIMEAVAPGTFPLERLQVIVPALAAADPLRLQFGPPAVAAAGRAIIAGLVDCLPLAGAGNQPATAGAGDQETGAGDQETAPGIPARLWPRLSSDDSPPGLLDALRAALILLADHELAASTLAARVAASVRADPYAVVATGLGAVGGALHGGASLGAETMLAAAQDAAGAPRVVGELLRRGERVPGFGHFVYRGGDPRAGLLLAMVRRAVPASPRLAVVDAVLAEMHRRSLPEPNIDFALAVLASCAGMIRGAGEVIFAVARTAGWLAHALEEYTARTPLRPRAVYTGPAHRLAGQGQPERPGSPHD